MSVSLRNETYEDAQVTTGGVLVLRLGVFDPAGISRIFVQCFPFSIANSNRAKTASGEFLVSSEQGASRDAFDVEIQIPEDAILGKGDLLLKGDRFDNQPDLNYAENACQPDGL
jgi:hypothetical protein